MIDADFEQVEETKGDLIVLDPKPQYKNKMEEVIDEANEANKKAIIEDLQELGENYRLAENRLKEAKLSLKSLIDDAKERGISKTMLESYVSICRMSALNKKAIFGAVVSTPEEDIDLEDE